MIHLTVNGNLGTVTVDNAVVRTNPRISGVTESFIDSDFILWDGNKSLTLIVSNGVNYNLVIAYAYRRIGTNN